MWQDGFRTIKEACVQFHEGVPTFFHLQKWFPKGGLLVLDDVMAEGGSRFKVQGSFISHYLYKVDMERKVQLQHMITR